MSRARASLPPKAWEDPEPRFIKQGLFRMEYFFIEKTQINISFRKIFCLGVSEGGKLISIIPKERFFCSFTKHKEKSIQQNPKNG